MDQVAALHWIKDNIGAFGGSPGNVTLLGTKRGAIFVNLLMLSPLAKGKFSTSTWTDDNSINLAVSRTKPTCLNWERPLFHYACSMLCSLTRDQHRTGKLEEPLQSYLITSASCFFCVHEKVMPPVWASLLDSTLRLRRRQRIYTQTANGPSKA